MAGAYTSIVKIALGNDHAGYDLKLYVAELLTKGGHEVLDLGAHSPEPVDYPQFCAAVGRAVRNGDADLGVVMGGSGQGEQIAANKVRGVRAALCGDAATADGARRWNDANVLALGLRVTAPTVAEEIVGAFLETDVDPAERAAINRVEPSPIAP
jgi:ribose 5-phosphate isomerase B